MIFESSMILLLHSALATTQAMAAVVRDTENQNICGRVFAAPFGVEESSHSRGSSPWLAAIFKNYDLTSFKFQCAGILISRRHVLTAAHCVKSSDNPQLEDDDAGSIVFLGLHDLRRIADINSQPREVKEIFVHPHYAKTLSHDADIAALLLKEAVVYNPYVRPICLPTESQLLDEMYDRVGIVVYWKVQKKNEKSLEPLLIGMPIVSQETCHRSNQQFLTLTSKRTFCAGFRNGTAISRGGGLYIKLNGVWFLAGIASGCILDKETMTCDLFQYVIFTNVAKHFNWLNQIILDKIM